MTSNVVLFFSVLVVFVFTDKIEGELNKNERLTFFLTKFEITEITEVSRRSGPLKFDEVDDSERSFRITAFGNTFLVDLTVFFHREDAILDYVSKLLNTTKTLYETDFLLYQGYVRNVNNSFALGHFTKRKTFRGYVITDEIFCIEPYESNAVIVYRFEDVIFPGCSKRAEDEEIDCTETRYFAPWYTNRAPPARPLLSSYNLFYDKYLRFFQRLQAKEAEGKKDGGQKDNSRAPDKHRGNKGKDINQIDRNKNKETDKENSAAKNKYLRTNHDIRVESDSGTKTGYPEMIKITDKNEIREYIQYKKEKYEAKQKKEKLKKDDNDDDEDDDDDDDDDDDYVKISKVDHQLPVKKSEAKKHGGKIDDDDDDDDYVKISKIDHQLPVKKSEAKKHGGKIDDDDDDDDDDYVKILKIDHRLQAETSEAKKVDGQKDNSTTYGKQRKDPDISDKRSKNTKNVRQKSEVKTYSKKRHGIVDESESGTTAKYPKEIKITDQNEIKEYMQFKAKKEPELIKEKIEKNDDDGDEEHYDTDNDKILRDDDRFTIPESNVAYQKYLVDKDNNSIKTSSLDVNGSRNIKNFIPNNVDFSGMWKESIKDIENLHMQPIVEALTESHPIEAAQCNVQLILSPSLLKKFDDDPDMLVRDIYIQITLLNKIFLKLPLRRRGKEIRFTFNIKQIVIHGDQVYSPFLGDRADLEGFTKLYKKPDDNCLTIGILNQYLRSGELYDGYTPEGNGGVCSRNGNTLLISHGNENTPAPMAVYFASFVRGITRSIGAKDKDKDCQEGSFPNPMQVLRDYLLAEKIIPSPEYSIFTKCNVKEIEKVLDVRGCFYSISQPLCGNAILDPGEECDCGPIVKCGQLDECCNNPNLYLDPSPSELKNGSVYKGCTLKDIYNCSVHEACCDSCKINTDKRVCYSGPFDCDIGRCDGVSASCPTDVEASNGMMCFTNETVSDPMICKDKKCDQLLCASFDLTPCTCASGTERECLYCCMKDGKCQTAGTELKLYSERNYNLPDGKECMGGYCMNGQCVTVTGERVLYNKTVNKPPRLPAKSDSQNKFSVLSVVIGTIFSLLVLFLLQV